jgi:hypothetical protein
MCARVVYEVRMLEREIQYYEQKLPEWQTQFPGKIVVVKGVDLVGVFDTLQQALDEGSRRFGLSSFLIRAVRRAGETVPDISIPALALGILRRADPPYPDSGSGSNS